MFHALEKNRLGTPILTQSVPLALWCICHSCKGFVPSADEDFWRKPNLSVREQQLGQAPEPLQKEGSA